MFNSDIEQLKAPSFKAKLLCYVYEGYNLAETCARMKINPAALAFARKEDIELDNDIRQAQAFRVDILVDKLEDITEYEPCPKMARVVSDNIKWLAAKRHREIYGEKMDINHNHSINLQAVLIEAKERTLGFDGAKPMNNIETSTAKITDELEIIELNAEPIDPLS